MKSNQSLVAFVVGALALSTLAPGQAVAQSVDDPDEESVGEVSSPAATSLPVRMALGVADRAVDGVAALTRSSTSLTGPGKPALDRAIAQASFFVQLAQDLDKAGHASPDPVAKLLEMASSSLDRAAAIAASREVQGAGKLPLILALARASKSMNSAAAIVRSAAS